VINAAGWASLDSTLFRGSDAFFCTADFGSIRIAPTVARERSHEDNAKLRLCMVLAAAAAAAAAVAGTNFA